MCSCQAFLLFLSRASARRMPEPSAFYPSFIGVRGHFPASKPLGRSAFPALPVAFQPGAALRGLVAALGSSGLMVPGRPGKCGAHGKPDRLA